MKKILFLGYSKKKLKLLIMYQQIKIIEFLILKKNFIKQNKRY